MGLHKLTAGDGYMYLIRQVAASDATDRGRPSLSDYYSAKGAPHGDDRSPHCQEQAGALNRHNSALSLL
jgi:hypothetical protein